MANIIGAVVAHYGPLLGQFGPTVLAQCRANVQARIRPLLVTATEPFALQLLGQLNQIRQISPPNWTMLLKHKCNVVTALSLCYKEVLQCNV